MAQKKTTPAEPVFRPGGYMFATTPYEYSPKAN